MTPRYPLTLAWLAAHACSSGPHRLDIEATCIAIADGEPTVALGWTEHLGAFYTPAGAAARLFETACKHAARQHYPADTRPACKVLRFPVDNVRRSG